MGDHLPISDLVLYVFKLLHGPHQQGLWHCFVLPWHHEGDVLGWLLLLRIVNSVPPLRSNIPDIFGESGPG